MAKVVQLRGQTPQGWSKDRWVWLKAVTADGRLLPMARLLANVLAQGFSNHETGECNPGVAALMKALAASRRTVFRALADLEGAGWLSRQGGEAPNRAATYRFEYPERVPAMTPERVPPVTPERVPHMTPERVPPVTPTGAMEEIPPIPPYKDKPNMNQNAGAKRWPRSATKVIVAGGVRPTQLSQLVEVGSAHEAAWNEWLVAHGFPALSEIGHKIGVGMLVGWDMPSRWPPSGSDEPATAVALRFAEWLRSKA
jgi:hypothetical protein